MHDVIAEGGILFLGSRFKRLSERLQADVQSVLESAGLAIQPSHYPILAALDQHDSMSVTEIVQIVGISQPSVTRLLASLMRLGLVQARKHESDQRQKTVRLTPAGEHLMRRSRATIWPMIAAALDDVVAGEGSALLGHLTAIEKALEASSLSQRIEDRARSSSAPGAMAIADLEILPFCDELAPYFDQINRQWIEAMFRLEPTDIETLENPRSKIIDQGGEILFIAAKDLGIVGTCALQKTGDAQFELTKMGVLETARGRKAGEYLLQAILARAARMRIKTLYLLTNSICESAVHLYEKLGFVHDKDIMARFGARYERCNVAMSYSADLLIAPRIATRNEGI